MKLEEQALLGILIAAAGFSILSSKEADSLQNKRHFHYMLSSTRDLKVNGILDVVHVGPNLGPRKDTFISTTGIIDSESGQVAELLFSSPTSASGTGLPPEIIPAYNNKQDRKSTRLNSSHSRASRMPSSA